MKKILSVISIAGITTFGLFAFMAYLISQDSAPVIDIHDPVVIDFVKIPDEPKVEVMVRKTLSPPPQPPVMEVSRSTPEVSEVNTEFTYVPTGIELPTQGSEIVTMSGAQNTEARPIVRVNPKYPVKALQNGTQGWVKLAFDINEIGKVINVKVIDSEPKRVFDKAAKQALKKWKYRAKSVDGKQIQQRDFTVQLDFNMEQQI